MADTSAPQLPPTPTPPLACVIPDAENLDVLIRQQGDIWMHRQWAKAAAYLLMLGTGWLLKHGFDQADASSISSIAVGGMGALALAGWEMFQSWTQQNDNARHAGLVALAAKDVAKSAALLLALALPFTLTGCNSLTVAATKPDGTKVFATSTSVLVSSQTRTHTLALDGIGSATETIADEDETSVVKTGLGTAATARGLSTVASKIKP